MKKILLCNLLQKTQYKLNYYFVIILHILVPLVISLLLAGYFSFQNYTAKDMRKAYMEVITMVYPILVAFDVFILFQIDKKEKEFQGILSNEANRRSLHICNVLALLLYSFIGVVIGFLSFEFGISIYLKVPASLQWMLRIAVVLFFANAPLYLLQYMICYGFGSGYELILGMIGTILNPMMTYSVGDKLWKLIPWSYGTRISLCYHKWLNDRSLFSTVQQSFEEDMLLVFGVCCFLILGFCLWGNRWEGQIVNTDLAK